jgi:tRNA threonylcarbamoyladenosine biosynthesis protein TsaE
VIHRDSKPIAYENPRSHEVMLQSANVDETRRLGMLLGEIVMAGDVVLLVGDLGAGKTAFTQGIGAGLGVAETINSPTFTILKEYAGRVPLHHFDFYRIEDPGELLALGFEEYFGAEGVCVVEWAERGETNAGSDAVWPASWLRVEFQKVSSSERALRCSAMGRRGQALLTELARAVNEAHGRQTDEGR